MKMIFFQVAMTMCQDDKAIMLYGDGLHNRDEVAKICMVDIAKCSNSKTQDLWGKCIEGRINLQVKRLTQ